MTHPTGTPSPLQVYTTFMSAQRVTESESQTDQYPMA
jgi:hypothetical protein